MSSKDTEYTVLKHEGKIYRIPKLPFETQEQSMDRVWYIVKHLEDPSDMKRILDQSFQWVYEKYLKVKYV
jgi:hypothetical protein